MKLPKRKSVIIGSIKLVCLIGTIVGIIYLCPAVLATGVSPGIIVIDKILSGTEYASKVTFSRADGSAPARIQIDIQGKDASVIVPKLIATDNIFDIKAGQNTFDFPFKINAKDLGTGDYDARIKGVMLNAAQDLESGSSMSIQSGAIAIIRFSVTSDQIEDYFISDVSVNDTEETTPVFINYRVNNNGNVMARPGKISVKITDQNDPAKIYSAEILQDKLELAGVGSTSEDNVESDIIVPLGDYSAESVFFKLDGSELFRSTSTFRCHPTGTLAQKGEMVEFTADKEELEPNEVIEFVGVLANTGSAPIKGGYVVEVFEDNKRVEYLKGDSLFVPKGTKVKQSLIYKPSKSGDYSAKGYFTYGISSTEQMVVKFRVSGLGWLVPVAGGGLIILLIIGTVWYVKRKRKTGAQANNNDSTANTTSPNVPATPKPVVKSDDIQRSGQESADNSKQQINI